MLTLTNRIDMRPGAVPLVIHLGQYDSDFSLVFELYSSAGNFTVESGTTAMIRGTKTDGHAYDADATINISAKTVTVTGSEQMTAAKGRNVYELVLKKGTKVLSTANFILDVERAAMDADTIASESVLKELNAIIAGAATATEAAADAATAADRAEDAADSVSSASAQIATNTADIADLKADLKHKTGLSEEAKVALLDCFEHVAWIDEHGQTYYNNLYDALYPESALVRLEAVFTQGSAVVYPTTPLDDLKAYLTVTGYYNDGTSGRITDYALSGTLVTGSSEVTVSKDGKTTTFTVNVSAPEWEYEWNASSQTIPTNMTGVSEYDFTTEPGAIYIRRSTAELNFDHIGDCEIEIEAKFNTYLGGSSAPTITLCTANAETEGHSIGGAITANKTANSPYISYNIDGNWVTTTYDQRQYHVYNIKAENGTISVTIDGTLVATGGGREWTHQIITGYTQPNYEPAYLKSIKFKRL